MILKKEVYFLSEKRKNSTKFKHVKRVLVYPLKKFVQTNSLSGNLLLLALVMGLVWANSDYQHQYHILWHETYAGITLGEYSLNMNLHHWINDGLMTIFFFLVGLEIKRELLVGELSVARKALFPVAAAFGGMMAPAIIFLLFQSAGSETIRGWAIPTATDIAFAIGILSLLGNRVPIALKVFLTALAIVDDIGAILLIGIFYSAAPSWGYLSLAIIIVAIMFCLNRAGVRNLLFYQILSVILWFVVLSSGVHATLAGVVAAFTIPVQGKISKKSAAKKSSKLADQLNDLSTSSKEVLGDAMYHSVLSQMSNLYKQAGTPLQRMEHRIHSLVSYFILPLFALANSGITIDPKMIGGVLDALSLGIIFGLCIGKPIGIVTICWVLEKLNFAERPDNISWQQLWASGCFAGIGFTMSIFIAGLAFDNAFFLNQSKLSIIIASFFSTILGTVLLLSSKDKVES